MPRESGASSKHRPCFYLKSLWLLDRPLSRAMTTEGYYLDRPVSSHFLSSHWFHRSIACAPLSAHHLSLIQNCFFKLLGSVGRSGAIFGSMYWIESAFSPG